MIIADASVAPHHAELVVTDDGRLHITDCATESGTWRRVRHAGAEGRWEPVRQTFIDEDDALRLGDHACTARELLGAVRQSPTGEEGRAGRRREYAEHQRRRRRGRVERDPVTGEIVRRRP